MATRPTPQRVPAPADPRRVVSDHVPVDADRVSSAKESRPSTRQPPSRTIRTASGYSRCSSIRMRADSRSTVSSSRTGTAACSDDRAAVELAGHEVHGRAADPHAVLERLRCASTPGNAGSSDGWTLRMACGNASSSRGPISRMKPARQTSETLRANGAPRERRVVVVARGERAVIEHQRLDPRGARALEPGGIRPVRDHDRDLSR